MRAPERGALIGCVVGAIAVGAVVARGHEVEMVVLLGAMLYGLVFIWNPAVALLLYVATRPAVEGFVMVGVGPVTVGQLWGAGLLLAATAFVIGTRSHSGVGKGVPLPILVLIALYAVLAARGDAATAIQYGLKLAAWLVMIVAVERIARTRSGQEACFIAGYALAVGSAILIGVLAATGKYGAAFYQETGAGSVAGDQQDPQALAFLALFSLSFPLIALLMRWWPLFSLALVAALTAEIVISYVRTALIACGLMLLVYIFVAGRRRRPSAFLLLGAFLVSIFVVQDQLAERFADVSMLTSGNASGAGSHRVAIWTSVWEASTASVQSAIAGGGAGATFALGEKAIGSAVNAHNDFLEFFATGGLLLVVAYVIFVAWAIGSIWRVYRDRAQSSGARAVAAIALGSVAAFLTTSFFSSISFYVAPVAFAILLGLIRGMAETPSRTCFDPVGSSVPARPALGP